MKSTIERYVYKINETIQYIEQNLDKDLSLEKLAGIAHYSPFHFHRVFTKLCNETPLAFVTRKRIERIAWILIKNKDVALKDLIHRYGFDNPMSFAKIFKKFYGFSASDLRNHIDKYYKQLNSKNSKIGKLDFFTKEYFCDVEEILRWMELNAKVEVRHIPTQSFAYIRVMGDPSLAVNAFIKLRDWAIENNIPHTQPKQWAWVLHDNPAFTLDDKVSHSACLKLLKDEEPIGINKLSIQKGKYLVGTFEIDDADFYKAWEGMSYYLMTAGYQFRDNIFYEIQYTDSIFKEGEPHKVDICLPIE